MMHAKGLCKGCADLYKAWAYYHEAVGDFRSANLVFEYGRRALAQPYEELMDAHQNLYIAAGQHVSRFFLCCRTVLSVTCFNSCSTCQRK